MAVTLGTSVGIFGRFGVNEDLRAKIATHQALVETEVDDILDEYNDDRDMAQDIMPQLEALKTASGAPLAQLRTIAAKTLIEMVFTDVELIAKTTANALVELVQQMIGAGSVGNADDDVDANVVTASVAAISGVNGGSATGNGACVFSVRDNQDFHSATTAGETIQTIRPEVITVRCIKDAQVRGTAGRDETFSVVGEKPYTNPDDPLWPGGSGVNTGIRVVTADEDGKQSVNRSLVVNGNMEDFTVADVLDNWTTVVGADGTDFVEEGTNKHRGSKALEIVGDGSTLPYMEQKFNTSGASTAKLYPNTKYLISAAIRDTGAGLAAGVVRISVQDDSDDSLIVASAFISKAFSDTGTSFVIYTAEFNTPLVLPSVCKVVIELTTAATNAQGFYVDDVIVAPIHKLGQGDNPYIAIIPGSTDFKVGDTFLVTMANGVEGELMQFCDRAFGLHARGLRPQLPADVDGTETLADSLVA